MFSPPLDTSVENNHKRLQQQSKKMLQLIVQVIWKQAVWSVSNSDRSCIAPCFTVTKAELMIALSKVNLQLPLTSRAADVAAITQPSSMLEDSWCKQTILVLKTWRSHRKILGLYYLLTIPSQYLQSTTNSCNIHSYRIHSKVLIHTFSSNISFYNPYLWWHLL